jgi:carbohydrate-selective porin OprB
MKKWGGEVSFPDIPGLYVRVACIRQNTHTKAYEYGFKFRNGSDRTIRLINVKLDDGMWNNKNWKIAPGSTGNFSDVFDRLTADAAPNVPVSVHIKAQYE